jgi:hypothetical protein
MVLGIFAARGVAYLVVAVDPADAARGDAAVPSKPLAIDRQCLLAAGMWCFCAPALVFIGWALLIQEQLRADGLLQPLLVACRLQPGVCLHGAPAVAAFAGFYG